MIKILSIDDIVQYLDNKKVLFDTNVEESILLLKEQAIRENNEILANKLWYFNSILNIQKLYIEMYNLLKNNIYDDYEKAWNLREKIDIALSYHRDKDYYDKNFAQLQFINYVIKNIKPLFPYKIFSSREMIIKKEVCSICGKIRSIRNNCGHELGKVYMGELCYNIVKDAELKGFAMVENPEDEYTILKTEDNKFNYEILELLVSGLNTPYDRWDLKETKVKKDEYKKIGRNEQCPCGSGKKYKKCCLNSSNETIPHYEIIYLDNPNAPKVKPFISNTILKNLD